MINKEKNVIMPHLGQGIEQAEIALWHFSEGDNVSCGEVLCEVVTSKVSFQIESEITGILVKKCYQEKEMIDIGKTIAIIKEEESL